MPLSAKDKEIARNFVEHLKASNLQAEIYQLVEDSFEVGQGDLAGVDAGSYNVSDIQFGLVVSGFVADAQRRIVASYGERVDIPLVATCLYKALGDAAWHDCVCPRKRYTKKLMPLRNCPLLQDSAGNASNVGFRLDKFAEKITRKRGTNQPLTILLCNEILASLQRSQPQAGTELASHARRLDALERAAKRPKLQDPSTASADSSWDA